MIRKSLPTITLIVLGFSLGWLSRGWWANEISVPLAENNLSPNKVTPSINKPIQNQDVQTIVNEPNSISKNSPTQALLKKETPSVLAQFQTYLNTYRYDEAVALYETQAQNNRNAIAQLRPTLLAYLESLLARQQFNDFSVLVDLFLSSYYDDIDVLLLLAEFNRINGLHIEAINIYQLANTYAYQPHQLENLWSHLNQFIKSTDSFFSAQEDWYFLSNFYSQLESSGLISPPYQYRQALVNLEIGEKRLAIEQLQALQYDNEVGRQAQKTLQQLSNNNDATQRPSWQSAQSIPLAQRGNQYLVGLRLNNQDEVNLLIDTGASMTTLSLEAFRTLSSQTEVTEIGQRVFNTANGITTGIIYRFSELSLGPYQLRNIPIAVLDFSMSQGTDGLLGMNILGQFRFQIDQENQVLSLSQRHTKN